MDYKKNFYIGFLGAFDSEANGADVSLAGPAPTCWAIAAFAAASSPFSLRPNPYASH
jgi:hypothetical protein